LARTRFQYPRWSVVVALAAGGLSLYVAYVYRLDEWWLPVFYVGFGLLCVLASWECLVSYMYLGEDVLEYRMNLKLVRIKKDEIEKVTWAAGCGVSVQLSNGSWEELPTFGKNSQGITNSVRAWLERKRHSEVAA